MCFRSISSVKALNIKPRRAQRLWLAKRYSFCVFIQGRPNCRVGHHCPGAKYRGPVCKKPGRMEGVLECTCVCGATARLGPVRCHSADRRGCQPRASAKRRRGTNIVPCGDGFQPRLWGKAPGTGGTLPNATAWPIGYSHTKYMESQV